MVAVAGVSAAAVAGELGPAGTSSMFCPGPFLPILPLPPANASTKSDVPVPAAIVRDMGTTAGEVRALDSRCNKRCLDQ